MRGLEKKPLQTRMDASDSNDTASARTPSYGVFFRLVFCTTQCSGGERRDVEIEKFSIFLKIGLNNPLNLPLRNVRQLIKVTGEATRSKQNAIAFH